MYIKIYRNLVFDWTFCLAEWVVVSWSLALYMCVWHCRPVWSLLWSRSHVYLTATLCLIFLARFFPALILSAIAISMVISSWICSSGISNINNEGSLCCQGRNREQYSALSMISASRYFGRSSIVIMCVSTAVWQASSTIGCKSGSHCIYHKQNLK